MADVRDLDVPEGWVRMTNPDLPGNETAVVTREAFEDNWADKGFKLSDREGNVVEDVADATDVTADENPAAVSASEGTSGPSEKPKPRSGSRGGDA